MMVTHTVVVTEVTEEGKVEEVTEAVSEADSAAQWVPPDACMGQGGSTGFAHKGHSTGLTQSIDLGALSSQAIAPPWHKAT